MFWPRRILRIHTVTQRWLEESSGSKTSPPKVSWCPSCTPTTRRSVCFFSLFQWKMRAQRSLSPHSSCRVSVRLKRCASCGRNSGKLVLVSYTFPGGNSGEQVRCKGLVKSRCAVDAGTSMSPYLTLPVECLPTALLWKCLASPGPPYSY